MQLEMTECGAVGNVSERSLWSLSADLTVEHHTVEVAALLLCSFKVWKIMFSWRLGWFLNRSNAVVSSMNTLS
jgi:hypothetical protein